MLHYKRTCRIPYSNRMTVADWEFGDYQRNPVRLRCYVKLLMLGLRHFPGNMGLVTFRIRRHNVKVETGDEEDHVAFTTHFNFFVEEFDEYRCQQEVTVTFGVKLVKQFLAAWDRKTQIVDMYFREGCGVVLVVECDGFDSQFMICTNAKIHRPNSPVTVEEDSFSATNITHPTADLSIANRSIQPDLTSASVSTGHVDQSMDASANSANPDDELYQFDDSLDEICSHVQDPNLTSTETSTAGREQSDGAIDPTANQISPDVSLQASSQSQSAPFDKNLFNEVGEDEDLFMPSRRILGWDVSRLEENVSDDEFAFD